MWPTELNGAEGILARSLARLDLPQSYYPYHQISMGSLCGHPDEILSSRQELWRWVLTALHGLGIHLWDGISLVSTTIHKSRSQWETYRLYCNRRLLFLVYPSLGRQKKYLYSVVSLGGNFTDRAKRERSSPCFEPRPLERARGFKC